MSADRGQKLAELQAGLKLVMRSFPQGVTVATTNAGGKPKGITVSSYTSVSLDPPLVLVSIAKTSALHDMFKSAGAFAVNFLADDQKSVSDRFAGRMDLADRFEGLKHRQGATGSPIIDGVRAIIECSMWAAYSGGDHSILVGEVVSAKQMNSKRPLVYYQQQYTTTEALEYPAPPSDIVW